MYDRLREDVRKARTTDPAAKSTAEVFLYAGVHAIWGYRLAHWLWNGGFRLTARFVSQVVRFLTGVEIHPGAGIGRRVFIDHGMGVVIGETAEIGDDVVMYHGVTLGGDDPRPVKRHPTVEDDVTLGAQSTVVGDVTIGEGATVGAGAVVVDDVPPGVTVAGNPARAIDDVTSDRSKAAEPGGDPLQRAERDSAPDPRGTSQSDSEPPAAEESTADGTAETTPSDRSDRPRREDGPIGAGRAEAAGDADPDGETPNDDGDSDSIVAYYSPRRGC